MFIGAHCIIELEYFQRQIKEHILLLSYITIKRFLTHIKITKSIESLFTFKSCKTATGEILKKVN